MDYSVVTNLLADGLLFMFFSSNFTPQVKEARSQSPTFILIFIF